ncbi:MAG TPA: NAD-dependent epimerase/dehydratase family protein [Gemmatimonadales bacterium]|nr:NAD-dependent epimerase/dehydratase family protein [Gemmatimonadales bacterium]
MTVLVTGGGGLVGTHVLEALRARDIPARALVRPSSRAIVEAFGAEPVVGDVTDPAPWQRATRGGGVRAIVHAAALVASPDSYDDFVRVNVGGTRLALEAAERERIPLVHVSSVAVYGRAMKQVGVSEDFSFQPLPDRDFYARSKRAAEELIRREAVNRQLSVIAIRPNVIYGERDKLFTERLIANLRRGILPQIGPGTNHLSCVYAGNVASAIVAALDGAPRRGFRAYHVTRDAEPLLTQREFFATFADALGLRPLRLRIPVGFIRFGVLAWRGLRSLVSPGRYSALGNAALSFILGENPYSTDRIRDELGWTPSFDTRTAIKRTVAWKLRVAV